MKKLLAILMITAMLVSTMAISANAALPPQKYGDADNDYDITIMDATAIQLHLANINMLYSDRKEAADVDGDSNVSIMDATTIQMYLAGLIGEFPAGDYYAIDKHLYGISSDFASGKAIAGIPVTFTADGYAYPGPDTFNLYVNDELVDKNSQSNTLSYTFEEAGTYSVHITVCDKWGDCAYSDDWSYFDFVVVDAPEDLTKPYISNIAVTKTYLIAPTITANVIYGSGDYTYSFYVTKEVFALDENNQPIFIDEIIYSKEKIKENSIKVEEGYLKTYGSYDVTVVVTDSNGNTVKEKTSFNCEPVAPA